MLVNMMINKCLSSLSDYLFVPFFINTARHGTNVVCDHSIIHQFDSMATIIKKNNLKR